MEVSTLFRPRTNAVRLLSITGCVRQPVMERGGVVSPKKESA